MVFRAKEVDVSSISSNGSTPLFMDQEVGEWVEGAVVSRGKFGIVYRGLLQDGTYIAVKKVRTAGRSTMELEALANEITLMKTLEHPCVVKYLGVEYVSMGGKVKIVLVLVDNEMNWRRDLVGW